MGWGSAMGGACVQQGSCWSWGERGQWEGPERGPEGGKASWWIPAACSCHFTPTVTLDMDVEGRSADSPGWHQSGVCSWEDLGSTYCLETAISRAICMSWSRPIAGYYLLAWTQPLPFCWPSLGSRVDWPPVLGWFGQHLPDPIQTHGSGWAAGTPYL